MQPETVKKMVLGAASLLALLGAAIAGWAVVAIVTSRLLPDGWLWLVVGLLAALGGFIFWTGVRTWLRVSPRTVRSVIALWVFLLMLVIGRLNQLFPIVESSPWKGLLLFLGGCMLYETLTGFCFRRLFPLNSPAPDSAVRP